MPKILRSLVLAAPLVVMAAAPVGAQTYPPTPGTSVGGLQGGAANAQADAAGTAFTGSPGIGTGTVLTATLLLLGLISLYVGWRRAERLTPSR